MRRWLQSLGILLTECRVIRLKVLGSTELLGDDGVELKRILAQPKRLALLVFLAVSGGFHRRDSLLAMFWPEFDPTRSRDALNQAVRFLRTELNDNNGLRVISRGAGELGLDPSAFWCDAAAFGEAVEARHHATALELYRGDLLPGFFTKGSDGFERWLEDKRSSLRLAAARAARELADAHERAGDSDRALATARRALDLAGLDEREMRVLLARMDRLGDRAGAISAYDAFAARLETELSAEPSVETHALMERIRRTEPQRRSKTAPAGDHAVVASIGADSDQTSSTPHLSTHTSRRITWRMALVAVAVPAALSILAAVLAAWHRPAPKYFTIEPPTGLRFNEAGFGLDIAISPDGETFAFVAGPERRLFVRRKYESAAVPFPTVTGISDLHFSGDGKRLTFRTRPDGGPTVLAIDGAPDAAEPVPMAITNGWTGISWGYSRDVVFAWNDALWRFKEGEQVPRRVAVRDSTMDLRWRHPRVLPDGKTIAFPVTPAGATKPDADQIALISIDGGARRLLDLKGEGVIGYTDGALIFSRRSTVSSGAQVMAVKVDLDRAALLGTPVVLLDSVDTKSEVGAMAALSESGTFAYLSNPPSEIMQIVDAQGGVQREIKGLRFYRMTTWSPDGRQIAMFVISDALPYIAVYDVESDVLNRLTEGIMPAWTPDGKRIGFVKDGPDGNQVGRVMWIAADGSTGPERIPGTEIFDRPMQVAFSADGRNVVVRHASRALPVDSPKAFVVPLQGGTAAPVAAEAPNAW
jgi:DNA-binding SARP family transcriptional activator